MAIKLMRLDESTNLVEADIEDVLNDLIEVMKDDEVAECKRCATVRGVPEESINQAINDTDNIKTSRMIGDRILGEALKIINGHRQDDYGSPEDSFQHIANYWNAYFKQVADYREDGLTPEDIAIMMVLFKIARLGHGYTRDSVVDICGYAAIYAAMHGD